jgi:hypothetical protein
VSLGSFTVYLNGHVLALPRRQSQIRTGNFCSSRTFESRCRWKPLQLAVCFHKINAKLANRCIVNPFRRALMSRLNRELI